MSTATMTLGESPSESDWVRLVLEGDDPFPFGVCPECRDQYIWRAISDEHNGCCDTHRVFWHICSDRDDNQRLFDGYREVALYFAPQVERGPK